MAQINITVNMNVLDSPILEQTQFGDDMKNWLTNAVDILNAEVNTVETVVETINNLFNNMIAVNTVNIGGSGANPPPVSVLGLTSSGFVIVSLLSSTNPVTILSVVPGTNQFTVTFSADPGPSAIISYVAFTKNPQG